MRSSRTRFRSTTLALTLIVALGGVVSACGGGSEESSESATAGSGPTEIRIVASGADQYPMQALFMVAERKGWFDEEGLDATVISGGGGGDTVRVATSGSADVALASATTILPVSEQGDLKTIGPWFQMNDFVWLRPEPGHLRDLEEATLGITSAGSSSEMMVTGFQEAFPDVQIEGLTAGSLGEQWAATKAGRLTAALSLPPYSNQLIAEEGAHVLVEGREVLGDLPVNLVAAVPEYAEQHPEALRAFWRVADRAMTYARKQPAKAAADIGEIVKIDVEYIEQALVHGRPGYSIKVKPEVLQNLSELMLNAGAIEEPLDWGAIMDQSFLPEEARARL